MPRGLVTEAYASRVRDGELARDAAQLRVAATLDDLIVRLERARLSAKGSALGWLFGSRRPEAVRGLYVHGGVGRGKTMLMDLFFQELPSPKKRRAHFHDFMADTHARIHAHRQAVKRGEAEGDAMEVVAEAIRAEARVLCFDEFAVTDVADAMVLARLFDRLFDLGVTLVATSNVAPRALYPDGLNRARFVPFIERLERQCDVLALGANGEGEDYRQGERERARVYVVAHSVGAPDADAGPLDAADASPLDVSDASPLDAAWVRFADGAAAPATIERQGRRIAVPLAVEGDPPGTEGSAARFGFHDLCGRPLGAADYAAIARRYRTVAVEGVPVFEPSLRNEAKRFIALVDTLYDHGTRLLVRAAAEPEALRGTLTRTEAFEFERTASRLTEMRGRDWVEGRAGPRDPA